MSRGGSRRCGSSLGWLIASVDFNSELRAAVCGGAEASRVEQAVRQSTTWLLPTCGYAQGGRRRSARGGRHGLMAERLAVAASAGRVVARASQQERERGMLPPVHSPTQIGYGLANT